MTGGWYSDVNGQSESVLESELVMVLFGCGSCGWA